ncbi:MAG TPA: response regulator transcription factor [Opitutaceae bacterium]
MKRNHAGSRRRPVEPKPGGNAGREAHLQAEATAGRRGVGIVDDHPMTRAGIAQLVNQQQDMFVSFEADSPQAALTAIAEHGPDLLLTDLTMEGRAGLEFIKDVLALHPLLPVLVLSMHDEFIYAERALRCGAHGYVMKDQGGDVLVSAIRRVLDGEIHVSPAMATRLLRNFGGFVETEEKSLTARLTDREFQILELLGYGKSTEEIAGQLLISPKTVDVHRSHIREKLQLSNRTALMRFAVRWVESETS